MSGWIEEINGKLVNIPISKKGRVKKKPTRKEMVEELVAVNCTDEFPDVKFLEEFYRNALRERFSAMTKKELEDAYAEYVEDTS